MVDKVGKRFKALSAVILTVCLTAALASCGETQSAETPSTPESSSPTPAKPPAAKEKFDAGSLYDRYQPASNSALEERIDLDTLVGVPLCVSYNPIRSTSCDQILTLFEQDGTYSMVLTVYLTGSYREANEVSLGTLRDIAGPEKFGKEVLAELSSIYRFKQIPGPAEPGIMCEGEAISLAATFYRDPSQYDSVLAEAAGRDYADTTDNGIALVPAPESAWSLVRTDEEFERLAIENFGGTSVLEEASCVGFQTINPGFGYSVPSLLIADKDGIVSEVWATPEIERISDPVEVTPRRM